MFRFIETIKFANHSFSNMSFHQKRVNRTLEKFYPKKKISLRKALKENLPSGDEMYKCRLVYSDQVEKIEFIRYKKKAVRSLKIVACDDFNYSYKFLDRTFIDGLIQLHQGFDDILMVKKGFITDTSYCNILFYNGKQWLTPSTPLLKGTQREYLLKKNVIKNLEIRAQDIHKFQSFMLVNAMLEFSPVRAVSVSNIYL